MNYLRVSALGTANKIRALSSASFETSYVRTFSGDPKFNKCPQLVVLTTSSPFSFLSVMLGRTSPTLIGLIDMVVEVECKDRWLTEKPLAIRLGANASA